MPLVAGTKLGPYEIVAPLGAGGMGEVYRARDARLGRDVAVKVLQESLGGSAWERFEREARAASALNHPNICAVYDVGEAGGSPYLVMELVEGRTLRDYIGKQPADPAAAVALGVQIADALEAAHAKGIIHRDIKSGNIMVTGRRHVKVLDFGLAKYAAAASETEDTLTMKSLTAAGTVLGTPHYMAPEILQGKPADARSDLWALGIVLHEMLTGRLPFQGSTAFEISSAVLREVPPALPAGVPSGLRSIVERCLQKRPEDRFQNAGQVREALEAQQATAAPSRRNWLYAAGTAAVLAAAGGYIALRPKAAAGRRLSSGGPPSTNEEANQLFELAMQFGHVQNDIPRALATLERALALDPHFAEALRFHALQSAILILNGFTNDTSILYRAEEELRRAVQEDSNLRGLPSAQLAVYIVQGRKELAPIEQAERELQQQPGQETVMWLVILRYLSEENTVAKAMLKDALQRDPLFAIARSFLGEILRTEGDVAGAIREQQKVLEQAPNHLPAVRALALAYLDTGAVDKARFALEDKKAIFGKNYLWRSVWALVLAVEGSRKEALLAMDEETLKFAGLAFPSTLQAAEVYAVLGETDKGIEWLERAIRNGDERATWFRRDLWLAGIRQDPRFRQVVDSIEARRRQRK
jgi:tetratricopeptide (TPR) repeat protein